MHSAEQVQIHGAEVEVPVPAGLVAHGADIELAIQLARERNAEFDEPCLVDGHDPVVLLAEIILEHAAAALGDAAAVQLLWRDVIVVAAALGERIAHIGQLPGIEAVRIEHGGGDGLLQAGEIVVLQGGAVGADRLHIGRVGQAAGAEQEGSQQAEDADSLHIGRSLRLTF